MENNKKSFLAMDVGNTLDKNGNVVPYAFFVEGIVTSVGTFREAADNKPAVQNLSILVGRNPWALLGKDIEAEQANNPDVNEDKPFVSIGVFGNAAARIKDIQKGQKVVLCGRPSKNGYKKKSGEDATVVSISVDEIYVCQNKNGEAEIPRSWVNSIVNRYEKQGEAQTQHVGMMACTVLRGADIRTTPSGQTVASAKVKLALPATEADARINRVYNKETDYGSHMEASIAVWGTRASKMGKILAPGNVLAVLVSSKTNTGNDGNVYVNLNARDLSVMKWGASADSATDAAPAAEPAPVPVSANDDDADPFTVATMDEDDMDLPF